jgi:hypothetical protein
MLVRGGIGLVPAASDERVGAAGSSGSNCGGGAGKGPGVSCALNNPGAAAAKKQTKTTTSLTLLFIIVLVAHIIVPYFFDAENPRQDASLAVVWVWSGLMRLPGTGAGLLVQ